MRIVRRATLLALVLAATVAAVASAHAMLLSSTPAVDSTLTSLPPTILLTFDDDLTSASSFTVLATSGATAATGGLDPTDPKSLTAPMPALANGSYEVRWTAISSDDGFIERGSFKFTVALAAPTSSASVMPAPSQPSEAPGPGYGDVLIPIVAAIVIVGGGLAWFLRRRGPA